ncbi:SDR family oxidoreductase [Neobacillus sp. DY30]|uniref:SDR family oxidoreductase n=1 Tax=Neobacillus sp. DY30 TaxID=3047871 RepID=UPI0024BFB15E|nr:SDR family oxidoreductase [Neobacillus sp. DY30]WHX98926.1 SDR family oxidoreductase [Neobacillus sp. DY30]
MKKKTALITGGAAGLGKKTACQLAKQGFQLAINYRNSKQEAILLAKELEEAYGSKIICIQGDVANQADCTNMVETVISEFTSIDVMIHNAGPYVRERKKMTEYSFDEWDYLINGNLNAVFYLSKAIIPIMRERQWGRIITMGFERVETTPGWVYRSAFAAAKTGLASLTRTIAIEEAANGITANMVCPGDIISHWKEKGIEEAALNESVPVGRHGTGEDISRVISFLVDDKSDFITGSIIPVTGGMDVLGKVYSQKNQSK